ncbi:MAG: SH3 domain-containing protein [Lachnospiraceae bacterium]
MKTKKIFVGILCAIMVLVGMPQATSAAVTAQSVGKVTGLKRGSTTTSSINISWNAQSGVSGYEIYRSSAYNGSYSRISTVYSGNTSFCNRNLSAGREYYYKVRSYANTAYGVKRGSFSSILTAATKNTSSRSGRSKANVRIRKHAGTNFGIVTTIPNNTLVTITATTQDGSGTAWYHVSATVNGTTYKGYIRSDLIGSGSSATPTTGKTGVVTASRLNVRTAASMKASVIRSIPKGTKVNILGTKNGDGRKWYHISFYSGKTIKGYAAAEYIKIK